MLENVLITDELAKRSSRTPDRREEHRALFEIARQMSERPSNVLQALCDNALQICQAGSSGISLLRTVDGEEGFSWDALAGQASPYLGGRAPRHHSPCGVTLKNGSAQLFSHPESYFEWLQVAKLPIVEGLVIPLFKKNSEAYGTIWIMSHDTNRRFDREDVRIMTELGGYATTALRLQGYFADWPSMASAT